MANLTYTKIATTGTALALTAADVAGDLLAPNDRGYLHVKNGSGVTVTVTVLVPGNTAYGQAQPDVPVSILAGAEKLIGPFPADLYDDTLGACKVTYSAVASVTRQALFI